MSSSSVGGGATEPGTPDTFAPPPPRRRREVGVGTKGQHLRATLVKVMGSALAHR